MKKIYRAEILGSNDCCTEFWEFIPLTDFYTSKERVEKEIEEFKELSGSKLENAIYNKFKVSCTTFGDNKPFIEEYDLIED